VTLTGIPLWTAIALSVIVILYGFWSIAEIPAESWSAAGKKRRNWVILMLLFGPLAVLLFFGTLRPQLRHPERYEVVDGVASVDG